jgi:hypothetical protein
MTTTKSTIDQLRKVANAADGTTLSALVDGRALRGLLDDLAARDERIAELVSAITSTVAEFDRQIAVWSDNDGEGDCEQAEYYRKLRAPLMAAIAKDGKAKS